MGGFDELLDVGSTIGGGGDLDLCARLVDRGVIAEYAPDALVWHHHRADPRDLARQFRGYGEATGACLMKALLDRPGVRSASVRYFVLRLVERARIARSVRRGDHLLPLRYLAIDVYGQFTGPWRYLAARRRAGSSR